MTRKSRPAGNEAAIPNNSELTTDQCSRLLDIATAPRADAKRYTVQQMTWPEFVRWLDLDHPADRKACGQYVPVSLHSGASGHRTAENVARRHLITLDADAAAADMRARCEALGWALAAHTTFSSTEAAPRWRVIVLPDRPLTPEEYPYAARAVAARLGADQFDSGSFQAERYMFRPGTSGAYDHVIVDGPEAPAAALLGEGRALPPLTRQRSRDGAEGAGYDGPPYAELPPAQQAAIRTHVARVMDHWAGVLAAAEQWDEGERDEDGRGWRQLMLEGAWALAKVAAAPWSPLDEEEAELAWTTICPAEMLDDPKCRGVWFEGIVDKALAREPVEAPPEPRATAADDFAVEPLAALFAATPIMRQIRDAAHSRGMSAQMVLVAVLARVGLLIPPEWKLPPVVGSPAPVNMAYALVGRSSSGKSAAGAIAEELLGIEGLEDRVRGIGSGEGLIDAYLDYELDKHHPPLVKPPAFLFEADEIETLSQLGQRSGSTLHSFLKSAVSGGRLGTPNAKAGGRNRHIKGGVYRLTMTVAVQPLMSEPLLRGEQDGFPQRFMFAFSYDPSRPRAGDDRPAWPGVLQWAPPAEARNVLDWEDEGPWEPRYIGYPDGVAAIVVETNDAQQDEDADPALGHAMLTRLKVAATLAFLHGLPDIDDLMWNLSGTLAELSEAARRQCKDAVAEAQQAAADTNARAAGRADVIRGEVIDADKAGLKRAGDAIERKLTAAGPEGVAWGDVQSAIGVKSRPYAKRARDQLEALGHIRVEDITAGKRRGERLWWIK